MSKVQKFTARELADALRQYGDMVAAVALVDEDGREIPVDFDTFDLTLEIRQVQPSGERYVTVVGYLDRDDGDDMRAEQEARY